VMAGGADPLVAADRVALAADVASTARPATERARPSARLLALLTLGVLVLAATGYMLTGAPALARLQAFGPAPAESGAAAAANGAPPQVTRAQIETMVEKLALRMKERPDDAQGWLMLARAYSVLDRPADALPAYARAASLRPDDATTLADYADAIALHNGGHADAQSDALIAKALTLEPANLKALALAGTAAFERADYPGAVREWQKMAAALPADDPERSRVEASIAEARQRGALPAGPTASERGSGTALASASSQPVRGGGSGTANANAATSVSGSVTLASTLAAHAAPDDTVFIFARAAQGPRMPLAVLRAHVKDLPMPYRLDDSMAMAPNAKLSGAAQVIVGARISRSGNATPQAGDLAGESAPVAPGARDVAITISTVVGP
jgi:cytochrome c-type biogenesis protein CcmH